MGTRKRLLDLPADGVPEALVQAVAAFCEPVEVIRSAYIGLIEITPVFHEPEEHLAAAFELAESSMDSSEAVREVELVADRFYETMPEELQEGGCNFLDAGGAAAWAEKARQVFSR